MDGDGEDLVGQRLRHGHLEGAVAEPYVEGLAVDADRIVDGRPDAELGKAALHAVAVAADAHGVLVIDVRAAGPLDGHGDAMPSGERRGEAPGVAPPRLVEGVQLRKLGQSDRRRDVREAEVVTQRLVLVALTRTVLAQRAQPR